MPTQINSHTNARYFECRWTLFEVAVIVAFLIGFLHLVPLIVRLTPWLETLAGSREGAMLLLVPLSDIFLCLFIWLSLARHGHSIKDLGLQPPRPVRSLCIAPLVYAATVPVVFLASHINQIVALRAGLQLREHPLLTALLNEPRIPMILFLIGYAVIIRPITEEIFFRGYLHPALRRELGKTPAIFAGALTFSALHFRPDLLLPLMVIGIVLSALYERTRSLPACMLVHALNNGLMVAIAFKQVS